MPNILNLQGKEIKATMKHHFTPTRTIIIKRHNKSADKDMEKSEPSNTASGNVQEFWKTLAVSQEIKSY